MEQQSKNSQAKVLELLRSLPHPGKILIDSVGDGISGLSLRPKSIPKKVIGNVQGLPWTVELKIMKGKESFIDGCQMRLDLHSPKWLEWSSEKPAFTIQAGDIGRKVVNIAAKKFTLFKEK